jgi:hypothetical protein
MADYPGKNQNAAQNVQDSFNNTNGSSGGMLKKLFNPNYDQGNSMVDAIQKRRQAMQEQNTNSSIDE